MKSPLRGNCGGLWRNGEAMGEVWKDVELAAEKVGEGIKSGGVCGENGGVGRKKSAKCEERESKCSPGAGRWKKRVDLWINGELAVRDVEGRGEKGRRVACWGGDLRQSGCTERRVRRCGEGRGRKICFLECGT